MSRPGFRYRSPVPPVSLACIRIRIRIRNRTLNRLPTDGSADGASAAAAC